MSQDVAQILIDAISKDFAEAYPRNSRIQLLLGKVQDGVATYAEAHEYAVEVSRLVGLSYQKYVSSDTLPDGRMYYNIASRLLPSTLDENYRLVSDYAQQVQKELNDRAGISLKAQVPPINQSKVDGLVEVAARAELYDTVAETVQIAIGTFTQSVVDDAVKANADFQYAAGLAPKIIRRTSGKCCKWCANLAGTYHYPNVPQDVYRRHANCNCTVEYDPGNGSKRRQNVHTKQWTDPDENVKILERRLVGLRANNVTIRSVSEHVKQRMEERSVLVDSIQDAIENPLKINPVKYDKERRPSFTVVGRKATLAVNPDTGAIVTCYPTHSKTREKLLKELKKK